MVIDQTGNLVNMKRHDYFPFCEELFAGTGGRNVTQGYTGGDGLRQQFTQKERDVETGLDYFINRYYSGVQSRFVSPDEFAGGPKEIWVLGSGHPEKQALKYAEVTNPQSLNNYQYCFNNPLRFTDPDGQNPQDGYELRLRRDEKAASRNPEAATQLANEAKWVAPVKWPQTAVTSVKTSVSYEKRQRKTESKPSRILRSEL